ncbi:aprataxin isoform X1 [Nasonia vitripennis]|uniref:HIT domain-containing protein n=2 Tax=Nasonia vitripennis TaxID=7425 RepID=A0A7M7G2J0_NASVI|nr:aprataxin isoform X1 [Nasonia vitripennis]
MQKSVKRLSKAAMYKASCVKQNISNLKPGHWSLGLLTSMNDPESKVEEDDRIAVIKDKYPKARFHYLVLPKKDISTISEVTRDDIELLQHMENIANKFVDIHKDYEFLVGYHAIPSMHRLHLHVISTDFDSRCLKTKQHWNSFTTPYFLPSKDVRKQLEETGEIKINAKQKEECLLRELKCHRCSYTSKTMPALKKHIIQHITQK